MIKKLFLIFIFATTAIAADAPPSLQEAINQYYDNKIDDALGTFTELSKQNNAEAYYYLGLIYSDNRFKQFNPQSAIAYLLSAADLNNVEAMNKLGLMYDNGIGVKQDYLIAFDWYRKAIQTETTNIKNMTFLDNNNDLKEIQYPELFLGLLKDAENGNAESQHKVAINYDSGALIPRNFDKALFWFKQAANNNYRESQFMLGYFYCRGLGLKQDSKLANDWLLKSGRAAICPK